MLQCSNSRLRGRYSKKVIHSCIFAQKCLVVLSDFGRKETVALAHLDKLPDAYMASPPFVSVCGLVSIYPAGGGKKWTITACETVQVSRLFCLVCFVSCRRIG